MSTSGHSLYRPIKISDVISLGFEIHDRKIESKSINGEPQSEQYTYSIVIKIHKDKIQKHIQHNRDWKSVMEFMIEEEEDHEYYFLHLFAIVTRKSNECFWSFTRYNINSPALNHFLEGICGMGYKVKIEGERFYYKDHEEFMNKTKEHLKKKLVESNN
jgi:hypothetical protein